MEPLGSTLSWTLNCMGSRGMREHHDTVVIGGGQAGLAMSAVLQQHGREQVVLDRLQIGERWRTERWESLRFQFPNWSLELPGYAYSGEDPDGFAHWREILRVIEDYAASTSAPVREHTEVSELRANDRGFALSVSDATIHARRVVIATGPIPAAAHPAAGRGRWAVGAADRPDALPAPGGPAGRCRACRG
jgi:putative flavoprotein involved in K+ transport